MKLPEKSLISDELDNGAIYEQVETALCIWEYVLDSRAADKTKREVDGSNIYEWITMEQGVYMGRSMAADLAWLVERAYRVGHGEEGEYRLDGLAFDWEIVPYIISTWAELFDNPTEITAEHADQLGATLPAALKEHYYGDSD